MLPRPTSGSARELASLSTDRRKSLSLRSYVQLFPEPRPTNTARHFNCLDLTPESTRFSIAAGPAAFTEVVFMEEGSIVGDSMVEGAMVADTEATDNC